MDNTSEPYDMELLMYHDDATNLKSLTYPTELPNAVPTYRLHDCVAKQTCQIDPPSFFVLKSNATPNKCQTYKLNLPEIDQPDAKTCVDAPKCRMPPGYETYSTIGQSLPLLERSILTTPIHGRQKRGNALIDVQWSSPSRMTVN